MLALTVIYKVLSAQTKPIYYHFTIYQEECFDYTSALSPDEIIDYTQLILWLYMMA